MDRAEAQRREFSANVSHELKTPLTAILGYSELIESGQTSPGDAARFAGKIRREATRLIRLVEDIIYLSELDEREGGNAERFMLYTLTVEVVQSIAPAAEAGEVTADVEGGQFELCANQRMVFGMIYNLVDNATKNNKPDGTVTVRLAKWDREIEIAVQDFGIGIPADCIGRLFERFYRVDPSRSKRTGGAGLGLSIVKHVALCHGGTVHAESAEGKGTTITVKLPMP